MLNKLELSASYEEDILPSKKIEDTNRFEKEEEYKQKEEDKSLQWVGDRQRRSQPCDINNNGDEMGIDYSKKAVTTHEKRNIYTSIHKEQWITQYKVETKSSLKKYIILPLKYLYNLI